MKHIFFFVFLAATLLACQPSSTESTANEEMESVSPFAVTGLMDSLETPVMIYLQDVIESKLVSVDSFESTDGKFSFMGEIGMPEARYLTIGETRSRKRFFLEQGEIKIEGKASEFNESSVSGSESHDLYDQFYEGIEPIDENISGLYEAYRLAEEAEDEAELEKLDEQYEALDQQKTEYTAQFIRDHSNSVVGPFLAYRNLTFAPDMELLQSLVSGLTPEIAASKYGVEFIDRVDLLAKVAVGQPATDFSQATPVGDSMALSDLKGQYVLIDFWASWCGPCRAENPNVVKLYDEYHDKGFEILGVSFDTKKDRWEKAIADDGLMWPQVSDLGGWQNAVGQLYGVRSIPHTVLLDPDQKIIAKNLRGEELREKIASLLDESDSGS